MLLYNHSNHHTYTLETIIQAGHRKLSICSVPIRVNPTTRPSRLFKSIPAYIRKSAITIIRVYVLYRPFHFFGVIGGFLVSCGLLLGLRYLYFLLVGAGGGHVQSLILMSVLFSIGFQVIMFAFIADLFAANRKVLEEIRLVQQKALLKKGERESCNDGCDSRSG